MEHIGTELEAIGYRIVHGEKGVENQGRGWDWFREEKQSGQRPRLQLLWPETMVELGRFWGPERSDRRALKV